jgi:hypothetical protein
MIMAGMNIFAAILVATFVRTGRTLPKPVPFCLSEIEVVKRKGEA